MNSRLENKLFFYYRHLCICCTFLMIMSGKVTAQPVAAQLTQNQSLPLNFISYTVNDGLPANSVNCFFQDSRNFIWIRTGNGLCRYDGIEFQNFFYTSKDSNSLASNDIRSICEMPYNLIFIGTSKGLCIYNNSLNKFENWRVTNNEIKPGSNTIITNLILDDNKNLWLNFKGELYVYDSLFHLKYRYTETDQGRVVSGIATLQPAFIRAKDGDIWFMGDNFGLVRLESGTLRPTCYKNSKDTVFKNQAIRGNYLDKRKSLLWYSPWGMGLYRYDLEHKTLKRFTFNAPTFFLRVRRNTINSILPYRHYLLCGTDKGLVVFNTINETYFIISHQPGNPFSLPDDALGRMLIDRDSILWVATASGISKSNLNKSIFGYISDELKESGSDAPVDINHFAIYRSDWLIIGTVHEGLYAYNRKTHERKHYFLPDQKNKVKSFNAKVFIDRENKIWVSTFYGLRIYYLEKNRMEMPPPELAGLSDCICIAFYQDSHLDYWMSYECEPRLIHCIREGNTHYRTEKYYYDNGTFPLKKIGSFSEDSAGNTWISTPWGLGFLKYDRKNNSFIRFPQVKTAEEYLSESVNDLLPDNAQSIWIASGAGHGLIAYNSITNKQYSYTTDNGLISNDIISLYRQNKNSIWVAAENGMSHINTLTGKINNYSTEDGLPEQYISGKFIYDRLTGLLYNSSPHFIIYFNPDSANLNKQAGRLHEIYLKSFQVNGNNLYYDFSKVLNLSSTENSVNLEFSCINFLDGAKIKFEYQLGGLESKWHECGKRKAVTYAHLDPGTYTFKVRISTDAVSYTEAPGIATFCIEAPFYATAWFFMLLTLIIASVVYVVHVYRKRNREALLAMRDRISRDLHDDIGSTLNSISIYSEIAKLKTTGETQRAKYLETIGASSRDMIDQMNDIVWTVNPMNDKFENILLRMRSFASELSEGKSVQLHFEVDDISKTISLGMNERKNFYLIFKEALNNAIKYSEATNVVIKVKVIENLLALHVEDNGVGFDPAANIEDHYKKGGNGLRNMRIRANEIHAELNIHSIVDEGTKLELKMRI
jgi:ligand-binding sensor domain-containing protein